MKKPDMTAVKQLLFDKGEKIGVVICTGLMVVVVGWSLWSGFSSRGTPSGKSWDEAIKVGATQLDDQINRATISEDSIDKPGSLDSARWAYMPSTFGGWMPLFFRPDPGLTKRLNPPTLALYPHEEDAKRFQFDWVQDVYRHYEIDPPQAKKVLTIVGGGGGGGKGMIGAMPAAMMPKNMAAGGAAGAGSGSAGNLAHGVRPVRMVVVSGVFPMKQQIEEFRKSLRFASTDELLAHRDMLPKPLGIEVARAEVLPGGKIATPYKDVFKYDFKTQKTIVAPKIREMLRHMVIDEANPQAIANYVFPGLVTPLPMLGNGTYAKLDLTGFDVKDMVAQVGADGENPMMPRPAAAKGGFGFKPKPNMVEAQGDQGVGAAVGGGAEVQLRPEPWKVAPKELQDRFNENYFAFDPLGTPQDDPKKPNAGAAAMVPPGAGGMADKMMGMMGGANLGAGSFANPWERMLGGAGAAGGALPPRGDAEENANAEQPNVAVVAAASKVTDVLVRFFDPDVQPGKTYIYFIRVRMANPNFGRKNDVAFNALADVKQLDWPAGTPNLPFPANGWMRTPEFTVPDDYHWYVVDQQPELRIKGGPDFGTPSQPGMAPVQVHRWVERGLDGDAPVGAWAVGERFWVRRGDAVGRSNVMVEVPRWDRAKQQFEIANLPQALRGKKAPAGAVLASGLAVDLTTNPPALVVDFDGGVRTNVRLGRDTFINDASAYNMLVLTGDGRLVMRNSRVDGDSEHHAGEERHERFEAWRDRLRELREGARPAGPAGGVPPGVPPGAPPRGGAAN